MDIINKLIWENRLKEKFNIHITSIPFDVICPDAVIISCGTEHWINPKYVNQLNEIIDKTVDQRWKEIIEKIINEMEEF